MKRLIFIFLIFTSGISFSQDFPLIGAQVFIEPGQTEAETEGWFRTMHENGMNICRIRMFESYMKKAEGQWDFSLFDRAFRYAEKYDIKVMGTFFPATEKTDIGGWKFPKDQQQLESFAEFIKQCVTHFRQFQSLYAWVLINEPGGGLQSNEFSNRMRAEWEKEHPQPENLENGYPVLVDLQDFRFKRYMTSWMLNWIASEIRKYDQTVHLHVNNHAIFSNAQEYDFPYWRTFLNSLGGSAHASWHFGMFKRNEYGLAISANCEILQSGAGQLPWLMTELQGGNNTYSAQNPMCPTSEEITQWLWTVIGTEGKGGIFWSLNPRASGIESGEWALLDFQHQPTDRVKAIKKVSDCLQRNSTMFSKTEKLESKINLVYIRESAWTESVVTEKTPAAVDGRKVGMKNMLGYFKALAEKGISANIKAIEEFDFSQSDYTVTTIILANQVSVPEPYVELLEKFVNKGGKLLVDGLTGSYDENIVNRFLTSSNLENLLGGQMSEIKYSDDVFYYELEGTAKKIPATLWKGYIHQNENSAVLASENGNAEATRAKKGKGEVIWIPGMLGMGAWIDAEPLSDYLDKELELSDAAFAFEGYHEGVLMKTIQSGANFITVLINKSDNEQEITLKGKKSGLQPEIVFNDFDGSVRKNVVKINPEETMVIRWK